MKIIISEHAKERMQKYGLKEHDIKDCLDNASSIIDGKDGRKIAQKNLNSYVLRVIYEKKEDVIIVITTYKAKSERYEI